MGQSLSQVYVHIVFSTKMRRPYIKPGVEPELFAYISGIVRNINGIVLKINGTTNHLHILALLPKVISIAKFLEEIKRNSSRWIKTKGEIYKSFSWQNGYGAFSISRYNLDMVKNYIENQKQHHKKKSFKDELRCFFKENEVEYDENYIWD